MKSILCYGDSNTWGHDPSGCGRFPASVRWPRAMAALLGGGFDVIEEGMCGRTTVYDDPIEPGRCGISSIDVCLVTHKPLDLVIFMLGTNDVKNYHFNTAYTIGRGMELLAAHADDAQYGADGLPPQILIVAPPHIGENYALAPFADFFDETSWRQSRELAGFYRGICSARGWHFLDAAAVVSVSEADAVHLTAEGHALLAQAMARRVREILG